MPATNCHTHQHHTLLYVGIAPARQPAVTRTSPPSTLRSRLRTHVRGNASISTLRLSLGVLLSDALGLTLQRTGRTGRLTFGEDEHALSRWMDDNARVCWLAAPEPWIIEHEMIVSLNLPLNLRGNERHPFHAALTAARAKARQSARERIDLPSSHVTTP